LPQHILDNLHRHGITTPTQIQERAIPAAMQGKDIQAESETGSGKTLAFLIPLFTKPLGRGVRALVMAPTRELAKQVCDEFAKFAPPGYSAVPVYGGVAIEPQIKKVKLAHAVIGTPGRILDLISRDALDLSNVDILVLDEADRMLDMGFIDDIERVIAKTPETRQTLLFSATLSQQIINLSRKYLKDPVRITVKPSFTKEHLQQVYYVTEDHKKASLLLHLMQEREARAKERGQQEKALVFCNTRANTASVASFLTKNGIRAFATSGAMTQSAREKVLKDYHEGRITVLVATDVAARGLHVEDVTTVYNFDVPSDTATYTHRIGRTARQGKEGLAVSIVSPRAFREFQRIEKENRSDLVREETPNFASVPFRHEHAAPRGGGRRFSHGRGARSERGAQRPRSTGSRREGRGQQSGQRTRTSRDGSRPRHPGRNRTSRQRQGRAPHKK
ncbi:DEAD/DEAH box helicase, partial [Candidatus Woesearchaeota archaeon]